MTDDLHDFDDWNIKKQWLHATQPSIMFNEGQIWWCSLGVNIGEEVLGKGKMYRRPVIVMRKISHYSCVVVPTTTKAKQGSWYFPFEVDDLKRWAMMHQIRFISSRRLSVRESILPAVEFKALKKAIADFYDL